MLRGNLHPKPFLTTHLPPPSKKKQLERPGLRLDRQFQLLRLTVLSKLNAEITSLFLFQGKRGKETRTAFTLFSQLSFNRNDLPEFLKPTIKATATLCQITW